VPSARGAEGPGLKSSPNDFLFSLADAFACWKLRLKSYRHDTIAMMMGRHLQAEVHGPYTDRNPEQ